MKIKSKLVFFILISLMLVTISQLSSALEPELLWKKEIPSKTHHVSFAKQSGDVIFIHGDKKNRITLIDKDGETRWQWGPDLELCVLDISISNDGRYFVFNSAYQLWVRMEKGARYKDYIHYYDRTKGELWKENIFGSSCISPEGKYVFITSPPEWGGPSILLDSNKKNLWKEDIGEIEDVVFSADSNYIAYSVSQFSPEVYLFNINEKNYKKIGIGDITSITNNGEYVGIEIGNHLFGYEFFKKYPPKEGIYNKEGNLAFEGKNTISENGKIVVSHFENRIEIRNFLSKEKIKEFSIQRWEYPKYPTYGRVNQVSYDGRYIAIFGKRTDKNSSSNLFLIDTQEGSLWEETIENVGKNDGISLFLTGDGKFLFVGISKEEKSTFYFYQIY